jgi:hypothetical protein
MSVASPGPDCHDLGFGASYAVQEPACVALEDYARELTRARATEALHPADAPLCVSGVHVCGPTAALDGCLLRDIEDFARALTVRSGGGGLGWS